MNDKQPIYLHIPRGGIGKLTTLMNHIEQIRKTGHPIIVVAKDHGKSDIRRQMALYEAFLKGELYETTIDGEGNKQYRSVCGEELTNNINLFRGDGCSGNSSKGYIDDPVGNRETRRKEARSRKK